MPRSCWVTVDKATIARKTVQCILLVGTYDGVKTAFPVGSPLVYRENLEEDSCSSASDEDVIVGGTSAQLAEDIHLFIRQKLDLPGNHLSHITGNTNLLIVPLLASYSVCCK